MVFLRPPLAVLSHPTNAGSNSLLTRFVRLVRFRPPLPTSPIKIQSRTSGRFGISIPFVQSRLGPRKHHAFDQDTC